jgi:hypothetical protein
VAVEKLHFPQNNEKLGDRKCLGKRRKSFVGHPDAILFREFHGTEFFNSHSAFTPTIIRTANSIQPSGLPPEDRFSNCPRYGRDSIGLLLPFS